MSHKSSHDKLLYPLRAWSIWMLSAAFMFYKYVIEVSPSVMTSTLMKTFDIGGVELGNFAAAYFYAYMFLQLPAGLLLDKFGPRKTTTLAIALCALGTLIFAFADSFFMANVGRFLTGIGAAFGVVNCLKLTSNWFPPKRFAFMAGLMMTMAMLGAVGGQAPLSSFINQWGWRHAMEILGWTGLALALLFWVVVRDKSPDHPRDWPIASTKISLLSSLKQALTNPQSWWLSLYSGFAFAPVMVFGGMWGVSFIETAFMLSDSPPIQRDLAAQMVSLIFIGFAVGAPVFGWLSDRLGRRRIVMTWGTLASLATISLVIYAPNFSQYVLTFLLFAFGFSISSFMLCFTMIREINTPMLAATAIGFMNAFDALVGAFSDPLTGQVLDQRWEGQLVEGARIFSVGAYQIAFLIIPAYLVLALLLLFKIKETHCRPTYPSALP